MRRLERLLVCVLAVLVAGCETTAYYAQAIGGHLDLMRRARPLPELIAEASTPAPLRERLALAARIRAFASRELGLPENDSYRSYVAIDRPYVVWNVVAAGEFSVRPAQSCFPFAGCVSYRGFFARADAEAHAASRRAEGLDVVVYGVPAYSTLGWFDDPLLSTFVAYPETELARLVFHELAHQVVYLKGDTTFNESFAVVVEEEGVRRWFEASGRLDALDAFHATQARKREFVALIDETRVRLEALYRRPLEAPAMRDAKRAEFEALKTRYAALRARWGGFAGYDRWLDTPNNALVASIATYTGRVPAFRRLLDETKGDLPAFYRRVAGLADANEAEREARLR